MKHELLVLPNTLEIILIQNPFEPRKETRIVPITNGTIFSYIDPTDKVIFYNGCEVTDPAAMFPQAGGQLVAMPDVGKGLRKILGWVVMAALTAFTAHWAAGLFAKTFLGSLGRALVSGAVLYLGGRVINGVFHLDQTGRNDQRDDTSYGWNLPTVQTTEGNVIGETFGECMPTAQLLMSHVETTNSDDQDKNVQYLNMLLCGGWGPIDSITDLRIGTTPIANFSDVQVETRLGTNDQGPISFLPDTILDQNIGLELSEGKAVTRTTETNKAKRLEATVEFPSGLYSINKKGNYTENTARFNIAYRKTGTSEWLAPNGPGGASTASGHIKNLKAKTTEPEVWTITPITSSDGKKRFESMIRGPLTFSVVGSVHGRQADGERGKMYENAYISFTMDRVESAVIYTGGSTYSITKSTSSAVRRTYVIANLEPGQYDVRITPTSLPSGTQKCSYMQWDTLSSYVYDGARTRPGKVLVALRIKATNQLSGSIPNVNWRQWRSTVLVWNPKINAYEEKSARNPIWAAYAILHGCKSLRNVNTGKDEYVIEGSAAKNFTQYWDQWEEAAAYCDEQLDDNDGGTENRFEFDAFYNSKITRWEAAQKAAAVGHATIIRHGTQYGVSVDKPGSICQIFGEGQTTVSSVSGSFAATSDRAKAVEITYNDTDNDFKNTLMKLYSPTYASDLSIQDNTAQVTLFGVKRRSQAYREGMYYMATNERELQTLQLSVDIAGIVCQYGDIIGINHAVPQLGLVSGRIVSVNGNTVTLDKAVTLQAGTAYGLVCSLSTTDEIITRAVVQVTETTTTDTLTVADPYAADKTPAKYDPYALGLLNKEVKPFRIIKTERNGDNQVTLTCLEYDAAVYETDYSKYPIIDYSNAQVLQLQAPEHLKLTERNLRTQEGMKLTSIYAVWDMPAGAAYDSFRVSYSVDDSTWQYLPAVYIPSAEITGLDSSQHYYVRVRAVKDGLESDAAAANLALSGSLMPAIVVTDLQTYTRFRQIGTGTAAYDLIVTWGPDGITGRVYYKTSYASSENTAGVAGTWSGWVYAGEGAGQIVIPQLLPGESIRIAVTTANELGQYALPDAVGYIDTIVAQQSVTPVSPSGVAVTFSDVATITWKPVTNTDILLYELRSNQNPGVAAGLLIQTNDIQASIQLPTRTGTIYLYAKNTAGTYSAAAAVTYTKPAPAAPAAPTVKAGIRSLSIETDAIPSDCIGAIVRIQGAGSARSVKIQDRILMIAVDPDIYDVTVAFYDLFGEGPASGATNCVVAQAIDPELLEGMQVTEQNLDDALKQTFADLKAADTSASESLAALQEADAAIQSRLTAVQETAAGNTSSISAVTQTIHAVNTKLASVTTKADNIETNVNSLTSTVNSNTAVLSSVQSAVNTANTTATAAQSTATTANTTATAAQNTATTANANASAAQSTANDIKAMLGKAPDATGQYTAITQTLSKVNTIVANLAKSPAQTGYSAITQLYDGIGLKVDKAGVVAAINVSAEGIKIAGKLVSIDASTTIANNVIANGMIQAKAVTADKMSVSSLSAICATIGTLRTKTSGARTEIKDNLIEVYDANNKIRVRLGLWNA